MTDFCKTCGHQGTRIDATYTISEQQFEDPYCGWCGVKWGAYVEAVRDQFFPKRKRQAKSHRNEMSRFGR